MNSDRRKSEEQILLTCWIEFVELKLIVLIGKPCPVLTCTEWLKCSNVRTCQCAAFSRLVQKLEDDGADKLTKEE